MSRRKKEQAPGEGPFNPYFGKTEDESHMPEKPFFTWILVIPGLALGLWLGLGTGELLMGLVCGAVFGIAGGSLLDKWREKRRKKRAGEDDG